MMSFDSNDLEWLVISPLLTKTGRVVMFLGW